jgi:hypothetical protein
LTHRPDQPHASGILRIPRIEAGDATVRGAITMTGRSG